jgi:hypothetical protein
MTPLKLKIILGIFLIILNIFTVLLSLIIISKNKNVKKYSYGYIRQRYPKT